MPATWWKNPEIGNKHPEKITDNLRDLRVPRID